MIHDVLMIDDETTLHIDGLEQWCAPVENRVTKVKSNLITDIAWVSIPSTKTVLLLAAFFSASKHNESFKSQFTMFVIHYM